MAEEIKNFRFKPFDVEIGQADADGKRKKITIRDLTYTQQKDFIAKLCRLITERSTLPTIIKALPDAIEREVVLKGMDSQKAIESFLKQVTDLYSNLNSDQIVDLLQMAIGSEEMKKEDIEKMGGGELLGLITFLIQIRVEPLKNFNASLNDSLFQTKA